MTKRILGILGVILGVIGVILAVVQLIGIWVANPTVIRELQNTAQTLNQGLIGADQVLTTADMIAGDLRAELQANEGDLQPVIDKYSENLRQIRNMVDTTNSAISIAQELVGLVNSLPFLTQGGNQLSQSEPLAETARRLAQLSQTLADLEQETPRLAQASQEVLARIDTRLGETKMDIEELITAVDQVQADLSRIEERIPFLINLISALLSLFAIWFGLAQYCLLLVSRRWVIESKQPIREEVRAS